MATEKVEIPRYHINPETGNPNICRATIQCRFQDSPHFDSRKEAADYYSAHKSSFNKGVKRGGKVEVIKTTIYQAASVENGFQARKYLWLWNHRDPQALQEALKVAKDKPFVENIIKLQELKAQEQRLLSQVVKHQASVANSKTLAQAEGYRRLLSQKTQELEEFRATKLQPLEEAATEAAKGYAKQLALHNNSLKTLENLSQRGVKLKPLGLEKRIATLEQLQKETPSLGDIPRKIATKSPRAIVEAAQLYGKPAYLAKAKAYLEAYDSGNKAKAQATRDALEPFLAEVRDHQTYETDITRELESLKRVALS